jgi:uncharacterized protein
MSKQSTIRWLLLLLILFCFRILAQFLQSITNIPLLPPFHVWHSSTIPYVWLLGSQIFIIVLSIAVIAQIRRGSYMCRNWRGKFLIWSGAIYFTLMCLRFVLSITIFRSHPWFGATLPAVFHVVLAGFLITLGIYEQTNAKGIESA